MCEDEVAVFNAKRWGRRNRADLIESATPRHDAQVVESYPGSDPLQLSVLTSKSEDYTTALQHLLNIGGVSKRLHDSRKLSVMGQIPEILSSS